MNLVDILIIFLLLGALLRGMELGFVHQLFSTIGFFSGLLLGALLAPHVVTYAHSAVARFAITVAATFGLALIVLFIGELAGTLIKRRVQLQRTVDKVDNGLGSLLGGVSVLVVVWLGAGILVTLPLTNLQSAIRDSKIVAGLDYRLPPTPNIIADIGHLIAPNGFPNVFNGLEPAPTPTTLPTPADLAAAVAKDRASVVKIQGQGCGGIVSGSGFVTGDTLIATNAHVVAGISSPYVIDGNGTHRATTIWFDPDLDFAVLRASNLAGAPLSFDVEPVERGRQGGVFGYPGGGAFQASSAAVLEEFTADGRNIYDQGDTTRDFYSVQADVVPGNSGGPLVETDGRVIGVIFATSTQYNHVGYALSVNQVIQEINQARAANQSVSTGSCAE